MKLLFDKYQGAGNDFIIVDGWYHVPELSHTHIRELCDRHFGIGADGLMVIRKHPEFDFEMLYYNSDGAPGSMCGNGGRCIVKFAITREYVGSSVRFLASDGMHRAKLLPDGYIGLEMGDVEEVKRFNHDLFLNTGSPHYIRMVDNVSDTDVVKDGRAIRYGDEFGKKGTNVNFVMPYSDGFYVRTYERGVEDETLSCGTGVTAVALASAWLDRKTGDHQVKIYTKGGEQQVGFSFDGEKFCNIWLEGPAELVFKGEINL